MNDAPNALRELARAADLLPRDGEAQIAAGNLLVLAGRFDEAQARARQVLTQE
jgi:Flp pilus assembly protein TadD